MINKVLDWWDDIDWDYIIFDLLLPGLGGVIVVFMCALIIGLIFSFSIIAGIIISVPIIIVSVMQGLSFLRDWLDHRKFYKNAKQHQAPLTNAYVNKHGHSVLPGAIHTKPKKTSPDTEIDDLLRAEIKDMIEANNNQKVKASLSKQVNF